MDADVKIAKLELHALLEDEQAELSAIQAKVDMGGMGRGGMGRGGMGGGGQQGGEQEHRH